MTNSNGQEKFIQLYDLAVANLGRHDISNTVKLLLEARELQEDTAQVDNLLGSCYLVLGEYERAVECWQQILAIQPHHKSARTNLELHNRPSNQFWIKRYQQAVAEVEKKNYQVGREMFRNLLLEQDGHVALYQLMGLCCLAGGDHHEAIQMWRKGLELDQFNPALHEYMTLLPGLEKIEPIPENTSDSSRNEGGGRTRLVWAASGVLLVFLLIPAVFLINRATDPETNSRLPVITQSTESVPVMAASEEKIQPEDKKTDIAVQNLSPAGSDYNIDKEEEYYFAGRKAYLSRNWKNAVDNYSVVVGMGTGSYINREALYYLARTNYLRGEMGQAEQYYLQYLKEFSGTAYYDDSLFFLGSIYAQQNNQERASKFFEQLKNIAPDSGYLSSNLYQKVMK